MGETNEIEKKQSLEEKRAKSWLKSVSSFANGIGGTIIFGITDDDELVGLQDAKEVSEKISETIKTRIDPIPQIILNIIEEEKKEFIILKVLGGQETPYYYISEGTRIAYVRVGNQSVMANAIDLKRLVLKSSNKSFDSLSTYYPFHLYLFDSLRAAFYFKHNIELEDSDFISFGLVDDKGMLTNAGALFLDQCPLYNSKVFCTCWNGLSKASGLKDCIDDAEYSGSLIRLLDFASAFVQRNTRKQWSKSDYGRIDMFDYPVAAVKECIVNALIHRDYLIGGSEIHIDIFDDRMEIYSPGGMVDGSMIQSKDTDMIPSIRRNPIIADVFSRLGFMERRGSGLKKVVEAYKKQPLYQDEYKPKFYSDHSSFIVTLYNLNYESNKSDGYVLSESWVEKQEAYLQMVKSELGRKENFNQRLANLKVNRNTRNKINTLFCNFGFDGAFSRKEIAQIIGLTSSPAGDLINKLKENNLIEPVIGQGKGYYKFT